MLSTLAIISIFTEIFAAGILLLGAATFFHSWRGRRQPKDLFLGLFFLAFFVNVAATIASQIMFNLGRELSELILVHKIIATSIILCALFLWEFIFERFTLKQWRFSYPVLILLAGFFIFRVWNSTVNLIYREGIIEPIVAFAVYIPVKPFFTLMWLLLAGFAFTNAGNSKSGPRKLMFCLGLAALLGVTSLLGAFLYVRFGEAGYLLGSWLLVLLAVLALVLAELIPPDSAEAKRPLQFFKSRILFKLTLIFVLLIVILFEATTLATINISKFALSRAIINNYQRMANSLAAEIAGRQPLSISQLQQLVAATTVDNQAEVFIVDQQGRLLAHLDTKRALQLEVLTANQAVARVLAGQAGGGEFRDELKNRMVGAYAPITSFGGGVVVEEPIASAYFEIRRLETNSLLFVIAGIILTTMVGIFFARSIEKPIKELTAGTEAVAKGDLHWESRINSTDEIGRLTTAFNKMTKDLRDSQERLILSEKLASLGTMAAGMAHEIKNPLVSLRTFTQLLQQKWEDQEFRAKFSAIIPQEIERINRIAESLLKFGKPLKPALAKVDINGLLEEVLMLFESECKKYNIRVTKKLAELPQVVGDAGQLQQVFVNVIKNALEAMQQQTAGELVIKTDLGEVVKLGKVNRQGHKNGPEMIWGEEEQLARPTPVVFIEISDSGEGITEDNLKSLFDPFFTTKMTGTGMGLPITLRIIEEHQGSVKVRSQEGKGTTFIITLPQMS